MGSGNHPSFHFTNIVANRLLLIPLAELGVEAS